MTKRRQPSGLPPRVSTKPDRAGAIRTAFADLRVDAKVMTPDAVGLLDDGEQT